MVQSISNGSQKGWIWFSACWVMLTILHSLDMYFCIFVKWYFFKERVAVGADSNPGDKVLR